MRDKIDLDFDSLLSESKLYESPTTEKQQKILAAAERLFGTQGFDRTPTAEIAKKAGVTERTLFKHFPSKSHLLRRLLFATVGRTVLPMQFRKVREFLETPHADFGTFFLAFANERLESIGQHRDKLKILIAEVLQNDRFRRQFARLWYEHIGRTACKVIERFQSEGKLRADLPPLQILRASFSLTVGYVLLRCIIDPETKRDDEKELRVTLDILLNGLRLPEK